MARAPRVAFGVAFGVGVAIFIDGVFFTVLAPLLPRLASEMHLSKGGAGALAASYALGALLSALPAFLLVTRLGPRSGLAAGAVVFALASVGFALASGTATLFAARLAQGIGCSLTWIAGLAAVTEDATPSQLGVRIGFVESTYIVGSLIGPLAGAGAGAYGRTPVFLAAAALSCILLPILLAAPARAGGGGGEAVKSGEARLTTAGRPHGESIAQLLGLLRGEGTLAAMWLLLLAAALVGLLSVVAPLRLASLHVGAAGIGAAFLIAACLQVALNPLIGRLAAGGRRTLLAPLAGAGACFLLLSIADGKLAAAALVGGAALSAGLMWTPGMASLSGVAMRGGADLTASAALISISWPPGLLLGSAAGGAIAQAGGDAAVFLLAAALCALGAAPLLRRPGSLAAAEPSSSASPRPDRP